MNYLFELLDKHLKEKDFRFIASNGGINIRFKQGAYVFYKMPIDIDLGENQTPYEEFLHSIELFRVKEKELVKTNVHFDDTSFIETIITKMLDKINEDAKKIKEDILEDFE